jgi:hypothetical protein
LGAEIGRVAAAADNNCLSRGCRTKLVGFVASDPTIKMISKVGGHHDPRRQRAGKHTASLDREFDLDLRCVGGDAPRRLDGTEIRLKHHV